MHTTTQTLFRAFGALALSLLLMLTLAGAAMAGHHHVRPPNPHHSGDYKSCGTVGVAQEHDWISLIDDTPKEAGNHWVVAIETRDGHCDFAKHVAGHIVSHSAAYFDRLAGGQTGLVKSADVPIAHSYCTWRIGVNDREKVKPFRVINCEMQEPLGHKQVAFVLLQVLIYPVPPFVFEA